MYTRFTIQSNKYKYEQGHPYQGADYVLRTRGSDGEFFDIGSAVKKEDKFKRTFLSCTLDEGFFIEGSKITINEKDSNQDTGGISPDEIW